MRSTEASGEQQIYLAPQHEDSVDVREDAVKAEVDVWTDQRKNRGQDAGSRLELGNTLDMLISFTQHPDLLFHLGK